MHAELPVELAGTKLRLLAERGVYWAAERTLFVADLHLGKEATFRRHSIPVPRGSSEATLARVSRMLHRCAAPRLVILGDLFHARSSLSADVCATFQAFRRRHGELECLLVRGNHDLACGPLPPALAVTTLDPPWLRGGIAGSHHPQPLPADAALLLCGHLHPAIRLRGDLASLGKTACFWWSGQQLVLPAIGDFTGTRVIRRQPGDRVWAVAEETVLALEPAWMA